MRLTANRRTAALVVLFLGVALTSVCRVTQAPAQASTAVSTATATVRVLEFNMCGADPSNKNGSASLCTGTGTTKAKTIVAAVQRMKIKPSFIVLDEVCEAQLATLSHAFPAGYHYGAAGHTVFSRQHVSIRMTTGTEQKRGCQPGADTKHYLGNALLSATAFAPGTVSKNIALIKHH